MIKIILIDDHILFCQGIRILLKSVNEIQVIGEASSGAEGVKLVRELKPDVVLLDMKLPDVSGLEVIKRLLRLSFPPKILILSAYHHQEFIKRALKAGVLGYISKDIALEELTCAIKTVNQDQRFLSTSIASQFALSKLDIEIDSILSKLNAHELEVLLLAIRGVAPKEIATNLHISSGVVHSYRSRLFRKLNVENNVGLALSAIREGLVAFEEIEG